MSGSWSHRGSRRPPRTLCGIGILAGVSLGIAADEVPPPPEPPSSHPTPPAVGSSGELPPEAAALLQNIALQLLPQKFDDEDGWGNQTRVQSGLEVDWDDGRLETHRRWKFVNHGSWVRAFGSFVDPDRTFRLTVTRNSARLPAADQRSAVGGASRPVRFDIRASARLAITARQQQWNLGWRLWSISADALADVNVRVVMDVHAEIGTSGDQTVLRVRPVVVDAAANVDSLEIRRVSHLKGGIVRESTGWLEKLVQDRLRRENADLARRIQKALDRHAEDLTLPLGLGGWLNGDENTEHFP